MDSNTRLRIPGEGEPGGNNGPAGDLYVVLDVKPHPYFERRDADLYCTVPVSIVQAALGTEIVVPGLNGEETVKIPEGTQTGEIIRLKGKGMPDPHGGGKGDLYVNIHVEVPTKLTREQRRCSNSLEPRCPLKIGPRIAILRCSKR